MAYDETLARRVRAVLGDLPTLTEKKMFGGVGYLINGNMACGVHREFLVVRIGPDHYQEALEKQHTEVFDITGRAMTGWVMVAPQGCAEDEALRAWIQQGLGFVSTLPAK
jgi:hypothetical protein